MKPVEITGRTLTIEEVVAVAYKKAEVAPLSEATRQQMDETQQWLDQAINQKQNTYYGINTGFGSHANDLIDSSQASQLSRNVVLSDTAAVGDPLPKEIVRAMMLVRANSIAGGPSGIRPVVVETFINMINKGVIPFVPHKGSLGASGDLALLSAIAVVATCDSEGGGYSGRAFYNGELMTGDEAMKKAGVPRLELIAKEGNAMINGTAFMASAGCLAVHKAESLLAQSEIAAAMSCEALLAVTGAFHPALNEASGQVGQAKTAAHIMELIQGSQLVDSTTRVQDAYCLRCIPQVLGPVHDTIAHARNYVARTLNAAIDNPLIFPAKEGEEPYICISGGAFHGEGLAFIMDFLSIVMSEVANFSDRRSFALLDPALNYGLPSMLIKSNGLNTGLMVAQYIAAGLVSDNKTLAHPDSVDSIPTSANQEDHVSMGANGARHLWEILTNVSYVIAVELLCAAQAIDLREDGPAKLGKGSRIAYEEVRKLVKYYECDTEMSPDLETLAELVRSNKMLDAVRGE